MAAHQRLAPGIGAPTFVNETGTAQRLAGGGYVNEASVAGLALAARSIGIALSSAAGRGATSLATRGLAAGRGAAFALGAASLAAWSLTSGSTRAAPTAVAALAVRGLAAARGAAMLVARVPVITRRFTVFMRGLRGG